ncbi:MAG: hypothetical protein ACLUO8_00195 [Christensenellales bacterium]
MPNNITLFKKYTSLLDEVYQNASVTSMLDMNGAMVRMGTNANEIVVPKISMDGLGDYSRNSGYAQGSVTLTHETVKFNYDRGRRFTVDAMDDEETAGVAFGSLSSEFIRTKAAPEQDAFRFATYASVSGISAATPASLTDAAAVLAALIASQNKMDEDEVPTTERYLFITPTLYNLVQNIDTTKSKAVMDSFAAVTKVPQTRFYTAIDLKDGLDHTGESGSDETSGGFAKASGGKNINFMVIHKPAVIQFSKHVVNKIITPEQNQTSDGWMFFYRSYGLADVYENKLSGIYLHAATT